MKVMVNKEKLKLFWEKIVKFVSHLSKIAIIIAAMFVGFSLGEIYHNYRMKMKSQEMQKTRDQDVTSVAINERGEVMIVDRKTGTYEVFSDSVGLMVFNLYASKIYYTSTKSEKK